MNKYIVFLILSIHCVFSNGQYKSIFGNASTKWNIIPNGACDGIYTLDLYISGDTMIEDKNYKLLNSVLASSEYNGYIREDTTIGKVWIKNTPEDEEVLVADFSLSKNDTFTIYGYSNEPNDFLVDTIYYEKGLKHIGLKFCSFSICSEEIQFTLIEGIGTNAGLFYTYPIYSYLLCCSKDDSKVYGNKLFNDSCSVNSVNIKTQTKIGNSLRIIPNPADDRVLIKWDNDNSELMSYEILSIRGTSICKWTSNNAENILYIRNFEPGVYYVRAIAANNQLFTKLFVKL